LGEEAYVGLFVLCKKLKMNKIFTLFKSKLKFFNDFAVFFLFALSDV
jgi:hypothetical protein